MNAETLNNPTQPGEVNQAAALMVLRARDYSFEFPRPALLMGIVNVTPDSFSDGGRFLDTQAAVDHALELVEQGADLLDIGGESTRPNAEPVPLEEELRRVMPVFEKLAGRVKVPLSIDTMKPAVAKAALAAGASLVNDVASSHADPEMCALAAQTGAGYVLMHTRGTPRTMQQNPVYADVVTEVGRFFAEGLARLLTAGLRTEQIILDAGFGFGKTVEHNLRLLAGLDRFLAWRRPLLLGVSRKSFIGAVAGVTDPQQRLPGSLACACWGIHAGVTIVRTHDVAATRQAVRLAEAIRGYRK